MLKSKQFPMLYGQDSMKRIKTWHISVLECESGSSQIITKHGLESGRKIETVREISRGKNLGRSNETCSYEQALSEARSKWRVKKEKDLYTDDITKLEGNDDEFLNVPRPMLAHKFNDHKLKISYPCYTQPKLDGYRGIYFKGKLYSRQGEEFNSQVTSHILEELSSLNIEWVLDGELCGTTFNSLGILKKKKLTKGDDVKKLNIKYHVYDIIDKNLRCIGRQKVLTDLFNVDLKYISLVLTEQVFSEKEIKRNHLKYTLDNYEGTMIRNILSNYECKKKSYNLQKYKDFIDDEFEIIGYTMEQGGLVVWRCKTELGKEFSVQSTGTKKERMVLFKEGDKYVGKKLWVKFFEYTEDGVPRFPKTMREGEKAIRLDLE